MIDMSSWPKSRDERVCPHGVGHPEPGKPHHGGGIHGCDGCCSVEGIKRREQWNAAQENNETNG